MQEERSTRRLMLIFHVRCWLNRHTTAVTYSSFIHIHYSCVCLCMCHRETTFFHAYSHTYTLTRVHEESHTHTSQLAYTHTHGTRASSSIQHTRPTNKQTFHFRPLFLWCFWVLQPAHRTTVDDHFSLSTSGMKKKYCQPWNDVKPSATHIKYIRSKIRYRVRNSKFQFYDQFLRQTISVSISLNLAAHL